MDLEHIPNGPEDKPFIFLTQYGDSVITYDIHDKDGHFYMLDHDFEGCTELAFSKPVLPESGKVMLDGEPVPYIVKPVKLYMEVIMIGIRLRGKITDYGQTGKLEISGFEDYDGNVMDPMQVSVRAAEKRLPLPQYAEHEQIALKAAEEGIVLLKNNNNVLPLTQEKVWNVFGKGLYDFRICAVGAGKTNSRYIVDFREAVQLCPETALNPELEKFYRCDEDWIPSDDMLKRARSQSDMAILMITRAAGENMDCNSERGEFYLSEDEESLLKKLTEVFSDVVMILNVGYPIGMNFEKKYPVSAIVYNGFGGMRAGEALVNILCGRENPSGRLPDTWVYEYQDLPSANNFYD